MPERKRAADYHAMGALRGAVWEGPEVPNANTRTGWGCLACGRRWQAIYNSLQVGTGCPACGVRKRAHTQRAKPEDYHKLAEERGFVWEGPAVLSAATKTGWRCPDGHSWTATYTKVRLGGGCPVCAGEGRTARAVAARHTVAAYHALAQRRGFAWEGPQVTHANAKTGWRCHKGHRWDASYNKIAHGRGCPACAPLRRAKKLRRKPADYHALARKRGFEWLGPKVEGALELTRWRCALGHEWEMCFTSVRQGYGCPECGDRVNGRPVSQLQRVLAARLEGVLNYRVGRRCIDVVIERDDVRIAVEYDAWYWHGATGELDARRDQELIALGWRVLRIRSAYLLPSIKELDAAIARVVEGEERVVITLPDWGDGPVRGEAYVPAEKPRPYHVRKGARHA